MTIEQILAGAAEAVRSAEARGLRRSGLMDVRPPPVAAPERPADTQGRSEAAGRR